tara:strand:- start:119 stop:634 length:516 start_codon:yes stop_codon:yes gene_type:complete
MRTLNIKTPFRFVFLLAAVVALHTGCAGKDKFQDKMKGIWVLQSRTTPEGKTLTPPGISGRLEWFPTDAEKRTAHVSVLTTHGKDGLQIHGSHYDLQDYNTFSQKSYLVAGGGISKTADQSYSNGQSTSGGTIQVEGARITMQHQGGPTYVFEGANLKIQHPDGTEDHLVK